MSPRPYQLGKRQAHVDEGRRRVLDAARELLGDASAYSGFTVEAVAKRADVARATVYYQFGSKTGLLEAVCDDLAEAGHMDDLGQVFANPDPVGALRGYIAAFGRCWAADRPVMRRLRALAALDPEVEAVIAARNERMRQGLSVLHAVISFEAFDSIAGRDRDLADILPLVTALAEAVIGLRSGSVR